MEVNKNKKLVYGIGLNDADYAVTKYETIEVGGKQKQKRVWFCPFYRVWASMLDRCYSAKTQEKRPTYKGCTVSDNWLTFSSFLAWMEKQDWEGRQLDKDLLFEGNKVYSPEACVFITQTVNKFVNDNGASRGKWLIGVTYHKPTEKFQAQCSNPFTKKRENLGLFTCEREAHQAWLERKLELAHLLAAEQDDPRVAKALIARYTDYKTQ